MATTESPADVDSPSQTSDSPLPAYVDWIVGAIIAFGGLALTVGGSALTFVVDRGLLAEGVESGQITIVVVERELSEAEMLDVTAAVVNWTGIGLLVTGIALVLFAIGYVVVRHRAQQQADDGETAATYRSYAVLGAVATAVLSFIPFSPVAGGGLAGYLGHQQTGRSVGIGGLAGFLAMLPALSILLFVSAGIYSGLSAVQAGGLGIVAVSAMLFAFLFAAVYGAGLGAFGGFLGGRIADEQS